MAQVGIRIPFPQGVKMTICNHERHLYDGESCIILTYPLWEYPVVVKSLEDAIDAVRDGPHNQILATRE